MVGEQGGMIPLPLARRGNPCGAAGKHPPTPLLEEGKKGGVITESVREATGAPRWNRVWGVALFLTWSPGLDD